MEKIIDCKGMACPMPVVNARKAAEELDNGDLLTVLVDNEIAVENLTRFAEHKGFDVAAEKKGEGEYAVVMRLTGSSTEKDRQETVSCVVDSRRNGNFDFFHGIIVGKAESDSALLH